MDPSLSADDLFWLTSELFALTVGPKFEVHEAGGVLLPCQPDVVRWAVSLLRDDDFGLPTNPFLLLIARLVVLLAVDEYHYVGILFNCPRFPEMFGPWPVVSGRFRLAIELGQAEHRYL